MGVVAAEAVVPPRETHWDALATATWRAGLVPHTRAVASEARPGPRGGKQGGVAIVCPAPQRLIEHRELIPGCAGEALVESASGTRA
eukprot:5390213-Lingulodinium_polyedra.AAC.1